MLVKQSFPTYIDVMTPHQFQLVGGAPALDFLNTIHDWTAAEPRDYLPTFAEVLRFAESAGVITAAEAKRLGALPEGRELGRLRDLRSRLERILRALVTERSPAAEDLEQLSEDAAHAAGDARLRSERGRVVRTIDTQNAGVATVRARLVEAAAQLVTSDEMARVRACPSCGWFFLDTTKNRSRRWCSMD